MWLKRTRVSSKDGERHYLQVVRTYYDHGKIRQKVAVNLGREDRVDRGAARSLVDCLNQGTLDSLPPEAMALLPSKEYGAVLLLTKAFLHSRMHRFFTDLGIYNSAPCEDLAEAVFFLSAYFILCGKPGEPFFRWAAGQYPPWGKVPGEGALGAAFGVLRTPELVHRAIESIQQSETGRELHFLCPLRWAPPGREPRELLVDIAANRTFFPYRLRPVHPGALPVLCAGREDLVAADSRSTPMEAVQSLGRRGFLCRVGREELGRWLPGDPDPGLLADEGGRFLPWAGGGYREHPFQEGGLRLFVIRPAPGIAPQVAPGHREPRDLFLTNLPGPSESLCAVFNQRESFGEHLYHFIFPGDLAPALGRYAASLPEIVCNLAHVRLLLAHRLEEHFADWGLTMEELLESVRGVRSAEISDGVHTRLYHTRLTDQQSRVLTAIDLPSHPRISLR